MQDLYLIHHGVEGQQWGKRNGPPYPLNKAGKAELRAQKKAEKEERKFDKAVKKYENRITSYIRRYSDEDKPAARERAIKDLNATLDLSKKMNNIHKVTSPVSLGALAVYSAATGAIPVAIIAAAAIPFDTLDKRRIDKKIDRERKALEKISGKKISEVKSEKTKTENKSDAKNDLASKVLSDQEYGDRYGRSEAKKYGLDQGDNYKMFRDAAAGDKRAQQVIDQWKSNAKNKK